jgi:hypothetical protein
MAKQLRSDPFSTVVGRYDDWFYLGFFPTSIPVHDQASTSYDMTLSFGHPGSSTLSIVHI